MCGGDEPRYQEVLQTVNITADLSDLKHVADVAAGLHCLVHLHLQ